MDTENKNTTPETQDQTPDQANASDAQDNATAAVTDTQTQAATPVNIAIDPIEFARIQAENARLKNKADALATENANQKKELRSYKSAEQIREDERREAEAAKDARLQELEKKIAISELSASIMPMTNDDARAARIAECLHGAEDAASAVLEFRRLQEELEKRLRVEYGKIPAPGIGGSDGPTYTKEQLFGMKGIEIVRFAREHPDEYNRIMGR